MSLTVVSASDFDYPSVPLITSTPFTGVLLDKDKANWKKWRGSMYSNLALNGLWSYTKTTAVSTRPDITIEPHAYANWIANDRYVCAFIFGATSLAERIAVTPFKSGAAAYWEALERRHKSGGPIEQVNLIKETLGITISGSDSFPAAVSQIFDMLDRAWDMGDIDIDSLKSMVVVNAFRNCQDFQLALLERMKLATKASPFTPFDILVFVEDRQRFLSAKNFDVSALTSKGLAGQNKSKGQIELCSNCHRPHHTYPYCISEGGGMAGKTLEESKAVRKWDKLTTRKGPTLIVPVIAPKF